jgi:hypothetical protein
MSFQPGWKQGKTGMFIIPADRAICMHCKEPLRKRHGINQNRPGETPSVCAWFLFGVGPLCLWDATKVWTDPDFFRRSGNNEYHANNWDLSKL